MNKHNIDRLLSINPSIASTLDHCAKVCKARGKWVDAENYMEAANEIRKRDEKIKYLQETLAKERLESGKFKEWEE